LGLNIFLHNLSIDFLRKGKGRLLASWDDQDWWTHLKKTFMQHFDTLDNGHFYHIYNHGVGMRDLFIDPDNYNNFLKLYDKYVSPVADTYAWVLMKNHFHVLVRIKENRGYRFSNADGSIDTVRFEEVKWETIDLAACEAPVCLKIPQPHLHFSHLFNAYSRYFNIRYNIRGALFERPFRRKRIMDADYLRNVVAYIHYNPVHHGFCNHPLEYPWSSYSTCLSNKTTKLHRDETLAWFGDKAAFELGHAKYDSDLNRTLLEWGD
jgi:REP element-mobilizing transposase RayT